jgi:hypothetical protein
MPSTTYYSYLLRLWQVKKDEEQEWRASLENVETGEKHGFASLEELFAFLKQVSIYINGTSDEGGHNQVQGGGDSPASWLSPL